jgi:hypothetical protein
MASEIHRRRTGRGLKVSEDIVTKEEMYEEEEDDLPRSYRYLTAHLQTNSPEMNHRVSAYISTQAAMATMAQYNKVNDLFRQAFPNVANFSQQTQNSVYMYPFTNNGPCSPSLPMSTSSPASRDESISTQSQFSNEDRRVSNVSSCHTPTTACASTPGLSPATTYTDTTESAGTPIPLPQSTFPNRSLDPQLARQPASSFTSELPNEVKMMANVNTNDPMAVHFFGDGIPQPFDMLNEYRGGLSSADEFKTSHLSDHAQSRSLIEFDEAFFPPHDGTADDTKIVSYDNFTQFNTPTGVDSIDTSGWETEFVDFGTEQ